MNNPLYRKMFQQPGMSRQPLGILASSPQLANTVQQRQQPVRMAQGGLNTTGGNANNLQVIVKQLEALKQSGDAKALQKIAADPNQSGLVKRIANNFAQSLLPSSVPLVQVGDVNLGNALSDATGRKPVGQSVGGQERSDVITPQVDVNLGNALSDFSGRKPIGQSVGGQERSAALSDAPSKIMEGLSTGIDKVGIGLTDVGEKISSALTVSPSEGVGTYRSPKEKQADVKNRLSKVFGFRGFGRPAEEIYDFEINTTKSQDVFDDGIETATDFEGGVAAGLPLTPAEELAASKTSTQNSAEKDASKETSKTRYEVVDSKPKLLTPETITLIGSETPEGNDLTLKVGETLTEAGKNISTGDLGLSSTEDLVNSIFSVDDAVSAKTGKQPTKKERVAAEMEILKEFFGEKAAKDIRTDFNYNLMMTGLLIAAGESPNAGTNIAKGLAAGLKNYGDATGEAAKQENELQRALGLQAYKNVTDELSAEKLSAAKERDTKIQVSAQIATANMNNNAAARRLSAQIGNNRDQWKAQLAQADSQFDTRMKVENKRLDMPPAEIRTLKTLMKQPELIEIMQKAAEAKDPNQTYSQILTGILKSSLMMTQFTKEDGSIDMQKAGAMARVAAAMAPSLTIGSTGSVETSAAGAGQQTTTIPAAPSGLPTGGKYSPQTKKWYTPDSSSSTGWSEWSGQAQ